MAATTRASSSNEYQRDHRSTVSEQDDLDMERRELAEQHTHLIRKVINQIGMRLPPYVQREDLIGVAALGLLDAAQKFDSSKGKRFASYAEYRIRGAILDELRHRDPMPRVLRGKFKKLERTVDELTRGLGRPPEDDEVAKAMGIRLAKYHEMRLLVEHASTVAYNEGLTQNYPSGPTKLDNGDATSAKALKPTKDDDDAEPGDFGPLTDLIRKEQIKLLSAAISELDTRDQLILSLHYQEDLNFRQIGEILSLTESRISQLHKGALLALKDKLSRLNEEDL
ncbi:MAG: FliA/WhiG family RNA polymerase sigma factor [Myxococcales bacterium]|nr:FliA/WhiG family RNA polymerase sigma factor [Myxococcales bacterium]